jgi:hypothetical protein
MVYPWGTLQEVPDFLLVQRSEPWHTPFCFEFEAVKPLDFRDKIHYNQVMMDEILRFVLLCVIVILASTAVFYLRTRRLSLQEYTIWGMMAILLPVVGPFLVIWMRPGRKQLPK